MKSLTATRWSCHRLAGASVGVNRNSRGIVRCAASISKLANAALGQPIPPIERHPGIHVRTDVDESAGVERCGVALQGFIVIGHADVEPDGVTARNYPRSQRDRRRRNYPGGSVDHCAGPKDPVHGGLQQRQLAPSTRRPNRSKSSGRRRSRSIPQANSVAVVSWPAANKMKSSSAIRRATSRYVVEACKQHEQEPIVALPEYGVCLGTKDQGLNDVVESSPHRR